MERTEDRGLGRALAELGAAQTRLQRLDDDYYVRGVLGLRPLPLDQDQARAGEGLHARVDAASKQRVILHHPDPRQLWAGADVGQRRELIRLVIERVEVPSARRGARFDPVSRPTRHPPPLPQRTPRTPTKRHTGSPAD